MEADVSYLSEISVQTESPAMVIGMYKDMVFRIAYAVCKNAADAEDAAQEVFVRYIRKKPVFISEEHRKAWLIRVTVNVSKNLVRSAWRRKVETGDERQETGKKEPETGQNVREAVLDLPVKYRAVVILYYFEDYSVKEIAGILRRTETAVQTQLQRARAMLKKTLQEDWNNDES